MERDRENETALKELGYTVIRFWGRPIIDNPKKCADEIEAILYPKLQENK
jgi:Uncharacterized protein conserved in bacteria